MSEQLSHKELLKQKQVYWKKQIENWQSSGMSQSSYCRKHDLKFHRFVYWRRKFHPSRQSAVSLVQVPLSKIAMPSLPRPVRLIVGAGRAIEVERNFDPIALKQLVHTLETL